MFRHEAKSNVRCGLENGRDQRAPDRVHEPSSNADGEGRVESRQIELVTLRSQDRARVLYENVYAIAQRCSARRRDEPATSAYEQRVTRRRAKARESPAHRRRAQVHAAGGAEHAPLGEQHVQREQQVQV
jgi:hypothetical protein